MTFAVAAGNEESDACTTSPSSELSAITVAATTVDSDSNDDSYDARVWFSNFGPCVDIAAPGELIKSAWIGSNTAVNTISGTSMASPHVAGVAAIVLSKNPNLTPVQVEQAMFSVATNGVIDLECPSGMKQICERTPNRLLYTNC